MAEPSIEQLHAALSSIFTSPVLAPAPVPGRPAPAPAPAMDLRAALKIVREDLEFPGDERKKDNPRVPRAVHSVALWNLAVRVLDLPPEPRIDPALRADLDKLIISIFRRSLDEIGALRREGIDPLLTFARAHKIDQYLWEKPVLKDGAVSAKLAMVIQTPVQAMEGAADPKHWERRSSLFWGKVKDIGRPPQGSVFQSTLNLPGAGAAQKTPVVIEAIPFDVPLGLGWTFKIFGNGVAPQPPLLCTSILTAEKEQGNPWATRITHEKRIDPASRDLGANIEDTLLFWLQAETVCLALP